MMIKIRAENRNPIPLQEAVLLPYFQASGTGTKRNRIPPLASRTRTERNRIPDLACGTGTEKNRIPALASGTGTERNRIPDLAFRIRIQNRK